MDGKIVLLMIAVVAVGMFALPSTLALYSGQHEFLNGSSVDCDKCHAGSDVSWTGGVNGELVNSTQNSSNNGTIHAAVGCEGCHQGTGTGTFHAASASGATCIACHATGDGFTQTGVNVTQELLGGSEVHTNMGTTDGAQDYACIACHTKATVNGTVAMGAVNADEVNITLEHNTSTVWI